MSFFIKDEKGNRRQKDGVDIVGSFLGGWTLQKGVAVDEEGYRRGPRAVASSAIVDRDNDVIIQSGITWRIGTDGKPEVAGPFGHDYSKTPVMRPEDLGVVGGKLQFTPVWVPEGRDEFVDSVFKAYEDGRMFGFSVGFVPKDWEWLTRAKLREMGMLGPLAEDATEEQREAENYIIGRLYNAIELVEISAVPVPANPDATVLHDLIGGDTKESDTVIDYLFESTKDPDKKELVIKSFKTTSAIQLKSIVSIEADDKTVDDPEPKDKPDDKDTKAGVPFKKWPMNDGPWSAVGARKRLAERAGISDKEAGDAEWKAFGEGFAIWPGKSESYVKADFKLPHHDIKDNEMVTMQRGCIAAAAALQGARGGVDATEEDIAAAKTHIGKHYKQWDGEAPWDTEEGKLVDELVSKESMDSKEFNTFLKMLIKVYGDDVDCWFGTEFSVLNENKEVENIVIDEVEVFEGKEIEVQKNDNDINTRLTNVETMLSKLCKHVLGEETEDINIEPEVVDDIVVMSTDSLFKIDKETDDVIELPAVSSLIKSKSKDKKEQRKVKANLAEDISAELGTLPAL